MKYIIILLLASDSIYVPFNENLTCAEQGQAIIETIATYHESGLEQGWYTKKGKLVYGFYCE
jgi:hypothetical protein